MYDDFIVEALDYYAQVHVLYAIEYRGTLCIL